MLLGDGPYWVKFVVKRVPASAARPHGLHYSLTLHGGQGERLLGFDNAHPVRHAASPGSGKRPEHDHRHRLQAVRPYDYRDAGTLLADFWAQVEAFLKERGVTP